VIAVEHGGLGLVDFPRRLRCLRVWWMKRIVEIHGQQWTLLAQKLWEKRFAPRDTVGDLVTMVNCRNVQTLRY
jgi:hypothetical protein